MRLTASNQKLQVGMLEAVTTTDPTFAIDFTQTEYPNAQKFLNAVGLVTAAAYADMIPLPANNVLVDVEELNIYNADTVTHNVLISLTIAGSVYVLHKAQLLTGQTLHYSKVYGYTIT